MGALFDTPHKGIFFNPKFIYTMVDDNQLTKLKNICQLFIINYQRWIVIKDISIKEIHNLSLNAGIVFYSKDYNCVRSTFDKSQKLLIFDDFINIIIEDHKIE